MLLELELEAVAEQLADVIPLPQANGLPAPSGGGGRNGRIIPNI